ncbi:histidinol dehydrogenase [Propionibacterium sp. oral taxon 192 str. F0372]|uniref:histidinol dehydrogenase n=1 Tax=Propionibacterium sp. oral taxon 192 TaxID=671222 RepID=UPI00035446A3|nr:histidinol dehydrogenase [Propionibacterium sp. oral taxon 192]EPH02734.1 histidinol dehydrogenase [Propionibacterium sp. oral taxon 192 str. F0372]
MLREIDLTTDRPSDLTSVLPRGTFDVDHAVEVVACVCDAVRDEGIAALERFSEQFDGVVPEHFRVPRQAMADALASLDPTVQAALEVAIERRRRVAETVEVEQAWRLVELAPGATVGNSIIPVSRVGLYVPGGLAPLASSVIMNVIPAQVAGVDSLAVATPPQAESGGLPHPVILAVCELLGVKEVFAVGGAQAVAMFAHGIPGLCPRVDLVTGPGNIYVVAAKRYLRGVVGIDSEAGPTEIAILADDTADPAFIAADLISQAEHDPMAGSVLITTSAQLAADVRAQVTEQLPALATADRLRISLGGEQSAIVLVPDLETGIEVANAYAAEHLEIHTADALGVARRIRNAGAIFVGPYSPVPLGDYSAGSTHVLPTSGAARYSSGLTVRSFMKSVHIIQYDAQGLAEIGDRVMAFADAENLPGHANAIRVRLKENR